MSTSLPSLTAAVILATVALLTVFTLVMTCTTLEQWRTFPGRARAYVRSRLASRSRADAPPRRRHGFAEAAAR
jgi:hypothetical protein